MTRLLTSILVLLAFVFTARATTYVCSDATLSVVQSNCTYASAGDVVQVPAGSETWSTSLVIIKNISLIGAGISNTIITGNNLGYDNGIIEATPNGSADLLRISGFSFDITEQIGIRLQSSGFPVESNVRIDHNEFYNSEQTAGGIWNHGCWGVIDNNVFHYLKYPCRIGWGKDSSGLATYQNVPDVVFGSADNMYVEDNVFYHNSAYPISNGERAGRYVFRYNYIIAGPTTSQPYFDIHEGNANNGLYAAMGGEVYGNIVTAGGVFMKHRGGKLAAFYNITGGSTFSLYMNQGCPPGTGDIYDRQLIHESYYFVNRVSTSGAIAGLGVGDQSCGSITADNNYWNYTASFDGTSGVGAGTLASRPATCTAGVGYWATDQSTTDLTGLCGTNPATPIEGTFYYASADNVWTELFTPYTYPHPLRGEGSANTNPPSITTDLTDLTMDIGQTANFQIYSSGTIPFTYYWFTNGTLDSSESDSIYSVSPVAASSPTNYQVILTNDYGSDTSRIAVLTIESNPVIGVSPTVWNYGLVEQGDSAQKIFVVTNSGSTTLSGGVTNLASPFSAVSGVPYSVSAGSSVNVLLQFAPIAGGTFTNTITFGGGDTETVRIWGHSPTIHSNYTWSATNGIITPPMETVSDYIQQPEATPDIEAGDQGIARYWFNIDTSGDYYFTASTFAPSTASNSMWVAVDGPPVDGLSNVWTMATNADFTTVPISWWGSGAGGTNQFPTNFWSLSAGVHELRLYGREAGTKVRTINAKIQVDEEAPPAPVGPVDVQTLIITGE